MARYTAGDIANALQGYDDARRSVGAWDAYAKALRPGHHMDIVLERACWSSRIDDKTNIWAYSRRLDSAMEFAFGLLGVDSVEISRDRDEITWVAVVRADGCRGESEVEVGSTALGVQVERAFVLCRALLDMYSPTLEEMGVDPDAPVMSWRNAVLEAAPVFTIGAALRGDFIPKQTPSGLLYFGESESAQDGG